MHLRDRLLTFGIALGLVLTLSAGTASAVQFGLGVWQQGIYLGGVDETGLGCQNGDPDGNTASCNGGGAVFGDLGITSWSMNVDQDPVVSGIVAVTNNAATTQNFTLIFTLDVVPAIVPSSLMGGSIQGGVTDNNGNGATLSTVIGQSFYSARIDDVSVATLYDHSTSVVAGNYLSANLAQIAFGTPIPSQPGPAVLDTIGIRLRFALSPGDSASFTSNFVVLPVPEPSVALLIGLGFGLLGVARRRGIV